MTNLFIPINIPFGINEIKKNSKIFKSEINKLRDLSKHIGLELEYEILITPNNKDFIKFGKVDHAWIEIPEKLINHYTSGKQIFILNVKIHTDILSISKEYSAPGDIYNDIIFNLSIYLQAFLNTFGFTCFSPLILINDEKIIFNSKIAYLINPWQNWFCDQSSLKIILNQQLKEMAKLEAKYYENLLPHVVKITNNINIDDLYKIDYKNNTLDYILNFGRIISEIIRLHPSHDYSAIIGMLTAYIEGLYKINGENRYKFKIKICNLLKDKNISSALNNIYDSRSYFFHTAQYGKINNIFEFLNIYFLIAVIKGTIIYSIDNEIETSTFDFR